ncbi:MFS transporter [Actinomadura rubrisoli]|uniref:DHA2 family efflux MFS transporter permease subunit n=1 Tax=Actinomadura rubrisoli TaxID=2530368 RepID=A0A4R5C8X8_9ACTN|nr:MFS transporter [Actinomadura rubrisoli]TDD95645.1 DHA2 family efflux MFS transporter permease subunit [Actinomadura rubrisoli]
MTARHRGLALALLVTVQFVLVLDASIVNVALPSIGRDLHFDQADLSWIGNAYTLAFGGFLLFGGRIADLAGRRRMFVAGIALFTLASLGGGLAPNAGTLVAARAVQGLGAALAAPAALSLIMTLYAPGPERNRALGLFGAVAGAGGAAGAILGGLLTDWFGWEAVLFVNVPIGAAAVALAPVLLPEARDEHARGFDLLGAASVTGGLALLVYTLVDANDAGWDSAQTYGFGAAAVVLLAAFVVVEARVRHPLVPLGIFRGRALSGGNLAAILMTMAVFPMFFVMTIYLQQVLGYGPIKAGLSQLPVAVSMALGAGAGSQLVTRFGARAPLAGGLAITSAGLAWFAQLSAPGGYVADVLGPSIVMGIGGGIAFVAVTIAATAGASADESGLASGLINTTQQIGGALGLAAVVAVSTAATKDAFSGGERVPSVALNEGFQAGMLTSAGMAIAAGLAALLLVPGRPRDEPPPAAAEPVLVDDAPAGER